MIDQSAQGKNISRLLEERGMSQAELAKLTGIDPRQINRYVKCGHLTSLLNAIRIAKVLDVTVEQLCEGVIKD